MTVAVQFDNVGLHYGSNAVIRHFNANITKGNVVGIIGLNGTGKTTLIKAIIGLREVNHGAVRIYGHKAGTLQAKRCVSYLPENFVPPDFLNGHAFLDFACRFHQRRVEQKVLQDYSAMLAMNDSILKQPVKTYSKGMRQKLGIIGTVLADVPCLILDEPMSGLDPLSRIEVKNILSKKRAEGKTIIVSSHILADMDEICDLLLVIADNRLIFQGTPGHLIDQSAMENLEKSFLALVGHVSS